MIRRRLFCLLSFTFALISVQPLLFADGDDAVAVAYEPTQYEVHLLPLGRGEISPTRDALAHAGVEFSNLVRKLNTRLDQGRLPQVITGVLVTMRIASSFSAVTIGSVRELKAPLKAAALLGLMGGSISGSFQAGSNYLSALMSYKGWLPSTLNRNKALGVQESFAKAFFIKQYAIGFLFNYSMTLGASLLQITPFDASPVVAIQMTGANLFAQGVLETQIGRISENLESRYRYANHVIPLVRNAILVINSFVGTMGSIYGFMGNHSQLAIMGTQAAIGFGTLAVMESQPGSTCRNLLGRLFKGRR